MPPESHAGLNPEWEIDSAGLKRWLDEGRDMLLLDVRREGEWNRSRLEGAKLIPLHELAARRGELAGNESRQVVVLCHHGVRSLRATEFLRSIGFLKVLSLAGGIDAYSQVVDPSIPRY